MSKVRIGCRLGNGLKIQRFKDAVEPGGMKQAEGPAVTLNGPANHGNAGFADPGSRSSDHGVTEIDKAWWDLWLAENELNPAVANGAVYFIEDVPEDDATAEA